MATDVQTILQSYEMLTDAAKQEVAAEIIRRSKSLDLPPLTDEQLTSLADDLFLEIDRRESHDG